MLQFKKFVAQTGVVSELILTLFENKEKTILYYQWDRNKNELS